MFSSNYPDHFAETFCRAKRKIDKNWVSGWYLQKYDVFNQLQSEIFYAKDEICWGFIPVITDTVCRFSGYKDINDIGIWEHDIIEESRRKLKGEVLLGLHARKSAGISAGRIRLRW